MKDYVDIPPAMMFPIPSVVKIWRVSPSEPVIFMG